MISLSCARGRCRLEMNDVPSTMSTLIGGTTTPSSFGALRTFFFSLTGGGAEGSVEWPGFVEVVGGGRWRGGDMGMATGEVMGTLGATGESFGAFSMLGDRGWADPEAL